jgi:hypothetical protein
VRGSPTASHLPRPLLSSLPGLLFRLKKHAMDICAAPAAAFASCAAGRTLSTTWACRAELAALSACLAPHTGPEAVAELRRRWLAAGRPADPDWGELLKGL